MALGDMDLKRARLLVATVAERAAPRLRSAHDLLSLRSSTVAWLPLRLPTIDCALGGGLSRGSLTEVFGEKSARASPFEARPIPFRLTCYPPLSTLQPPWVVRSWGRQVPGKHSYA